MFLSVVTELTATLLLIPTGAATLLPQFWVYEQNVSYGATLSPSALTIGAAVCQIMLRLFIAL